MGVRGASLVFANWAVPVCAARAVAVCGSGVRLDVGVSVGGSGVNVAVSGRAVGVGVMLGSGVQVGGGRRVGTVVGLGRGVQVAGGANQTGVGEGPGVFVGCGVAGGVGE